MLSKTLLLKNVGFFPIKMPLPSFIYFTIFVHDIFYCAVFVQKSSPTSLCERVFLPVIGNFFLRQEISSYGTNFFFYGRTFLQYFILLI